MDRRTFLVRMGTTLGAALSATSLTGCAGLAAARHPDGRLDVPAYVAAMDAQVARIHALPDRPEIEELLAERALPSGFLKRYMASLFLVAAFRDTPRAVQEHPAMQDRIWREAPWLGEAQLRLARTMRGLDKQDRKALRAAMTNDRQALDAVREGLLQSAVGSDVEPERAQQLVSLYDQITFRMRAQDPGILLDEVLGKVARRAASVGAGEETWDELLDGPEELSTAAVKAAVQELEAARLAAGGRPVRGSDDTELAELPERAVLASLSEGPDAPWPTVPEPEAHGAGWEEAWGNSPKAARLATTGVVLMGIGLVLLPTGVILSVFAFFYIFPPVLATIGAVLSIMGMVYLITAGAEGKKRPRRERREERWDR